MAKPRRPWRAAGARSHAMSTTCVPEIARAESGPLALLERIVTSVESANRNSIARRLRGNLPEPVGCRAGDGEPEPPHAFAEQSDERDAGGEDAHAAPVGIERAHADEERGRLRR